MSKIFALLAGAALAATALVGVAPASAQSPPEAATVLGPVLIDESDPTIGYVTARYRCYGGGAHLWVSVKQTADGRPDNRLKGEGSSAFADTWLHAHPGDEVVCDGTWQTQTFTVDLYDDPPPWPGGNGKGALVPGQGYVQFCLYSPMSGDDGVTFQNFRAVR